MFCCCVCVDQQQVEVLQRRVTSMPVEDESLRREVDGLRSSVTRSQATIAELETNLAVCVCAVVRV